MIPRCSILGYVKLAVNQAYLVGNIGIQNEISETAADSSESLNTEGSKRYRVSELCLLTRLELVCKTITRRDWALSHLFQISKTL
jgi:hypothetical protein